MDWKLHCSVFRELPRLYGSGAAYEGKGSPIEGADKSSLSPFDDSRTERRRIGPVCLCELRDGLRYQELRFERRRVSGAGGSW